MGTMIEFVAVGGMLAVTPGPNMVYVMSRSVSQGPRAGLTSLAGVMLGYLTYMFGAAFGLTAIFLTIPGAARVLAAAGALYLLYLSWQAVRPGARSPFEVNARQAERPRRLFAMGAATSLLNPKLAMLFLSLLPQFIDYQAGDVFRQSMLLGASLVVAFAAVNGAVAIGSGSLAGFLAKRPNWLRAQRWVMGLMLFSLAAKMALDIWR
ncbi:LysE family translocator [Burkholderia gladioli]|jgi:threonine/homoserine/homoserine lactone efflux protein|uniref:LysE family translocator n=1 Tax=Burkholderia gladioli TaxID=28095 RepID=A0AB38TZR8_BURGA|nr:LysE family translocator [Burkholderia gladioli]MBA1365058.1 LysE family translocator [Burkholderia gladioli]MBJ9662347.1 LysE family translocator [Burkholderia gladioli]MBU9264981.1 LysE family translocator [Burkholderia gladioli]MBU9271867.1 LysE family translocator [Burkholderia gladioli]MBU9684345.1 LysE family translocator [Burkholderia gladioli]